MFSLHVTYAMLKLWRLIGTHWFAPRIDLRGAAIKRWLGLIIERRAFTGSAVYNSPRKEETSHTIRLRIPRADGRVDTHWKVRAFGKRHAVRWTRSSYSPTTKGAKTPKSLYRGGKSFLGNLLNLWLKMDAREGTVVASRRCGRCHANWSLCNAGGLHLTVALLHVAPSNHTDCILPKRTSSYDLSEISHGRARTTWRLLVTTSN